VEQKVGDWKRAFDAVREELTPPQMRTILAEMKEVEGVAQLRSYMELAAIVSANDRTAASVAATLVYSGVRQPVTYDEED
jgi:hypothetical protein